MKTLLRLALLALLGPDAHAQFYAPPVDFHDVAQRRFPVEAARVLAWLQSSKEAPISEVTYQAEPEAGGQTSWTFEWHRSASEILRKATVRYAEADLRTGAKWYRSVWAQLTGADWILPPTPAELVTSFWEGGEGAGLARMTGVASALEQLEATPQPSASDCARLAGTLVQAAQPSLTSSVTLDGSLLARSAAWLCAAEQKSAVQVSAEWAPLLTLAGRDGDAQKAWGAGHAPAGSAAPVWQCWDLVVRMPPAREALTTICRPENRLYAAPVFEAYSDVDEIYYQHFIPLVRALYRNRLPLLYDYAPSLNRSNREKPVSEQHPILELRAVLDNLQRLTPWPGDAEQAPSLAGDIADFANKKRATFDPPSPELVALIGLGIHDDRGPLVPVAVATARDLLMFLFEESGEQFGQMSSSLFSLWESKNAQACEQNWALALPEWQMHLWIRDGSRVPPPADTSRYQYLSKRIVSRFLIESPPADWPRTPDAAFRRRWLSHSARNLEFLLVHDGRAPQFTELVRRSIQEGSQRQMALLLSRNNCVTEEIPGQEKWRFDQMLDQLQLRDELIAAAPLNVKAPLAVLKARLDRQRDPLVYAQEMERFHWKTGFGVMPQTVFHQYVRANALTSARRFYDRWGRTMTDPTAFDMMLGEANFMLGALQSDPAWVKAAAADVTPTWDRAVELAAALLDDDIDEAKRLLEDKIKHGSNDRATPTYQRMLEFLPFIRALNSPQHPDHAQAVDSFPRYDWTLMAQWILLAKAHLPPEEAIRFIGGDDDESDRALLVLALRGDAKGFEELYDRTEGRSPTVHYGWETPHREGGRAILYAWLRNLLLKIPPPKEEPDLMPPDSEPLFPLLHRLAAEPLPGEPTKKR